MPITIGWSDIPPVPVAVHLVVIVAKLAAVSAVSPVFTSEPPASYRYFGQSGVNGAGVGVAVGVPGIGVGVGGGTTPVPTAITVYILLRVLSGPSATWPAGNVFENSV